MIIRKMDQDEIREVKRIIDSNFRRSIKMTSLQDSIMNPYKSTYVGIVNSEIVVTVGIRESYKVVWLASKYKRMGYARVIMTWLMSNNDILHLAVKKDNYPAIHLYKSLGFNLTGQNDTSYFMEFRK